ncbi:hypothetical protein HYW43_00135 [Candidatus Daviesbacteria bacterium]|nr:hypothetical protein [Candidatus Daviesbacteria bacterium]
MIPLLYLILLTVTLIGTVLSRSLIDEKRLFINIPVGMILGTSLYIFLLNIFSKFFPGQMGIIFSTISLLLIAIFTSFFHYKKIINVKWPKLLNILLLLVITIPVIYFARLKMTSVFPVADSDMQWAYAASFTRGNYPLKVPWQPDLTPNYHLGAYFFEGALLTLTGLPLITIHSVLNVYFLIAGVLFAIFLFWEKNRFQNIWLILASIVTYISFGVLILILPSQNFFQVLDIHSLFNAITQLPYLWAKGTAGAALVDLNSLSYLPARSLGIGLAFLAYYFTFIPFRNSKIKILSFVLLFSVTALVEESVFLPLFLTLVSIYLLSLLQFLPSLNDLKKHSKGLLITISAIAVTVLLQGGFVSDLLTQKGSAYNILLPLSKSFLDRFPASFSIMPSISTPYNLLILSPFILSVIVLVYSIFKKRRNLAVFCLFSLVSLFSYLTIEYKYSPTNNIRFYNFASISSGLAFVYFLYDLMKDRSLSKNLVVFSVLSFLMLPSFIPEIINQSKQLQTARMNDNRSKILISSHPLTPFEKISDWANKNLPPDSRLVSIDTDIPSPKRSVQFQYKGLYTTLAPQYIHTTRPEPGTEYFDLILTLNPSILKQTKTQYVYIESESDAYKQLPKFRKDELEDENYFEKLQSVDYQDNQKKEIFFRLYRVLPQYLDPQSGVKEINEGTLRTLNILIPNLSTVYISDYGDPPHFSFWYRMAVVLQLKDKQIRRNISQTDYQAIETNLIYTTGNSNQRYDYYISAPNQKPFLPATLIWSNIYASAWKIDG